MNSQKAILRPRSAAADGSRPCREPPAPQCQELGAARLMLGSGVRRRDPLRRWCCEPSRSARWFDWVEERFRPTRLVTTAATLYRGAGRSRWDGWCPCRLLRRTPSPWCPSPAILEAPMSVGKNRAALALRLAAWSLMRSKSYLGAYLRRQRSRLGAPKAITATAHKLARLVYYLVRFGAAYSKQTEEAYAAQVRERLEKQLHRRAGELGYTLTKLESAAPAATP